MGLLEDLMRENAAQQELKAAGSVMARDQKPQWRQDLPQTYGATVGTGMQTGLDLLDALLQFGPTPLDAGGSGAQILPATWKAMAPEAKAMMSQFGNQYPGAFSKVLQSPADITAKVTKAMPKGAAGMLQKPLADKHVMSVLPDYAQGPYTVGHELQHSLNVPRVAATDPLDALTIGTLIRDLLPSGHRGSLDTLLKGQLMPDPKAPLMQQLKGMVTGNGPKVVNPQTANRNVMRGVMDEALAYTGENSARPGADPLLKILAERLGVNWE